MQLKIKLRVVISSWVLDCGRVWSYIDFGLLKVMTCEDRLCLLKPVQGGKVAWTQRNEFGGGRGRGSENTQTQSTLCQALHSMLGIKGWMRQNYNHVDLEVCFEKSRVLLWEIISAWWKYLYSVSPIKKKGSLCCGRKERIQTQKIWIPVLALSCPGLEKSVFWSLPSSFVKLNCCYVIPSISQALWSSKEIMAEKTYKILKCYEVLIIIILWL